MAELVKIDDEQKNKPILPYPSGFYSIHLLGIICGISFVMFLFTFIFSTAIYSLIWFLIFLGTLPPLMRLN